MKYRFPAEFDKRILSPIGHELGTTRDEIVKALSMAEGGREVLAELMKPDLYAAKGRKDVLMRLYRGPDGLFLGHAHGADGRIIGQARWLKVGDAGSRLLASAGVLTGQLMLLELSQKLDRIQGSVDKIREALDDDRMQELRGAMNAVKDALETRSNDNRKQLLNAAIPNLSSAISKMIAALRREIAEIPTAPDWKLVQVVVDRN